MIEEAIAKLTTAVNRNNELLEAVLASAGTAPAPAAAETPAPAAESKPPRTPKKPLVVVTPPPAQDSVEEEESDAPEEPAYTLRQVIDATKKVLAKNRDLYNPKLKALRASFGVETVADLKEEQFNAYMAELAKIEA